VAAQNLKDGTEAACLIELTNSKVPTRVPFVFENLIRKLLFIKSTKDLNESQTYKLFSKSMFISGLRCLLSYVILPLLAPILKFTTTLEPIFGIPIGLTAIIFDYLGIRRFWISDHRFKWLVSPIYLAVIVLVVILIIQDIASLAK
jgi:hypothetical protein